MSSIHKEAAAEVLTSVAAAMPAETGEVLPALDEAIRVSGHDNIHTRTQLLRAIFDCLPPPWSAMSFNTAQDHPRSWRDLGGYQTVNSYFGQTDQTVENLAQLLSAAAERAEAIANDR